MPLHDASAATKTRARALSLGRSMRGTAMGLVLALAAIGAAGQARADLPTPFAQSLAIAAGGDEALSVFYRERGYAPLWTGPGDAERRAALFEALAGAGDHGLSTRRHDPEVLKDQLRAVRTEGDLGRLEAAMSLAYLSLAKDLTSGMLDPAKVDSTIVREIRKEEPGLLLAALAGADPAAVMRDLAPKSDVYARLMAEKYALEALIGRGSGWGPKVPVAKLAPGASGANVVALRDRLTAMGFMRASATRDYDRSISAAVLAFQNAHGLPADGTAGEATLVELNREPAERLKSVIVAMERERWMEIDRSGRMIWVNLPDYSAEIRDDGRVSFRTRSVIGREDMDRRTPEFSDMMDHMVVNPSWGVPRSIIVGEYLPLLQRNPNAVGHFQIIDRNGRVVPRGSVNFAAYTARSFPFGMRQPPGDSNALGKVKFMFPNKYNIYLHDTPAKSLFAHDRRAYSHGCIRLADPFDFAHALFLTQAPEIEREFDATLKTGRETPVKLAVRVPIHLVYFTAYPEAKGRMGYRRDVYDRDAKLWSAMEAAGVALAPLSH